MDDSRTFNVANELTARDTDSNSSNNYSPTYDDVGNMTDDGKQYTLVYDAFGRLRFIKDRSSGNVIEEFVYNGLNHRIAWHYDADTDSDVDGNDPWYYFVYDRQWRMVATVRNGDSEAKELFVNHQAGSNGTRMALPLDATLLRDRHNGGAWSAQATGSSYNRAYYCQNFFGGRGDVVAILSDSGKLSQQVRFSAYGVPTGLPAGDTDANGSIVSTPDITAMIGWLGTSEVRGDLDLDGDSDNDDMTILTGNLGLGLGWNKLSIGVDQSLSGVLGGHRKGYCGYEHDWTNHSVMHVRNRAYFAELGRWTRRDPLGYVDGANLYAYAQGHAISSTDPLGLWHWEGTSPPEHIGPVPIDDPIRDKKKICIVGAPNCAPACREASEDDKSDCFRDGQVNPRPPGYSCDNYPLCYEYAGANARCFCRCAPNDAWSNYVRTCLSCMFDRGVCAQSAHDQCYASAPGLPPAWDLFTCWVACVGEQRLLIQAGYCPGVRIPVPGAPL